MAVEIFEAEEKNFPRLFNRLNDLTIKSTFYIVSILFKKEDLLRNCRNILISTNI